LSITAAEFGLSLKSGKGQPSFLPCRLQQISIKVLRATRSESDNDPLKDRAPVVCLTHGSQMT